LSPVERNVHAFDQDVLCNQGYLYTTNSQLSSRLANKRLTDVSLALLDFSGLKVIDVGCGDGTYTIELWDLARPRSVVGIDPAPSAIEAADARKGDRPIVFQVGSAYHLDAADDDFDVAVLRGVLHHLDYPGSAIREALRVARRIVVVEPNGYNPVLKVIERTMRYHIEHGEKSYAPRRLRRWVEQARGRIVRAKYAGLVPMFCPDWMARALKRIEPVVEDLPLVDALGCAVYIFAAARTYE